MEDRLRRTSPEALLSATGHRPYPLPGRAWRLRQRWNDLLFAHWPVPPASVAALLPPGLDVDTFDGAAWLGVVPFWMDEVATRVAGQRSASFPGTRSFNELNLRTYVRSPRSGKHGVFFFALDCDSPLAVIGARVLFHLPYYFARMKHRLARGAAANSPNMRYSSRRILDCTRPPLEVEAAYRPIARPLPPSAPGTLEHFLTERYCLFTSSRGRMFCGNIHHRPWPLQPAEAEFRRNSLPAAYGFSLPDVAPLLHYSRELEVLLWGLEPDESAGQRRDGLH